MSGHGSPTGDWNLGDVSSFWDNTVKPAYTNYTGLGAITTALQPKKPSNPAAPTTSDPTLQQTNTTAIQNELANEANATATVLTGGRGVTAMPLTSSAVLMGR